MEEVSLDTQAQVQLHLDTPEEVAEKANKIDSGIHGEEKPRVSFYGYLCKVFGKWCGRVNLTIRW